MEDVKNKLRTLYKGAKKDNLINRIASTFVALCEYGDFSASSPKVEPQKAENMDPKPPAAGTSPREEPPAKQTLGSLALDALQYHINIVLPESRDQAVYDAIFKSLRDHLGPRK